MKWLVFSYSLPSKLSTSSRVRIWRKLRKSGAVSPKAGVYVLPYTDDCAEAIRWLATEVEQEQGETLVMQVDRFENLPNDKVIDIFRNERKADYEEIEAFLLELEQIVQEAREKSHDNVLVFNRDIKKIKKNIEDAARVDFFSAFDKRKLLDRLHCLQQSLITGNLILLILFSVGAKDEMALSKLSEESVCVESQELLEIKRVNDKF